MKKTYFSSDWHLGHTNIIKYDKRPFNNIEEMDKTIIDNYNSIVYNGDDFYFLGDFAFNKNKIELEKYFQELNGNIFFIKGNHDHKDTIKLYEKYGTYLGNLTEIEINNQRIVLCHYAMRVWNKSHHGTWHLYGHSHHSLPDDKNSLSFDIGLMGYNYKPIEFEEVKQIMNKKEYKSIDHH